MFKLQDLVRSTLKGKPVVIGTIVDTSKEGRINKFQVQTERNERIWFTSRGLEKYVPAPPAPRPVFPPGPAPGAPMDIVDSADDDSDEISDDDDDREDEIGR